MTGAKAIDEIRASVTPLPEVMAKAKAEGKELRCSLMVSAELIDSYRAGADHVVPVLLSLAESQIRRALDKLTKG